MASGPSCEAEGSTDGVDRLSGSDCDDDVTEDTASSETSAPQSKRKKYSCTY